MQFNSFLFILCFLPLTLLGYFALNRAYKNRGGGGYFLPEQVWYSMRILTPERWFRLA